MIIMIDFNNFSVTPILIVSYDVMKYSSGNFICREMFWSFSPTNLAQICKPMTVLESARPEDSETLPDC